MRRTSQGFMSASALAVAVGMTGCGSSDSGDGTGYLSLGISDAPVHDATKVCIAFDHIEFKGEKAPFTVDLGAVENVNLLEFQGANAAPLLFREPLPVGAYQFMRLGVIATLGGTGGTGDDPASDLCVGEQSYIAFEDGTVHNLYVPSGAERGLQFNGAFVIAAGQTANFTVEVDLMRSLATPPGLKPDMIFKPTLKLVNNLEAGTLIGEVMAELATAVDEVTEAACAPSVFVFDDGVIPNGIDPAVEDPDDPVATAMVHPFDQGDGTTGYNYSVGFLVAGDYEVAFTCNGTDFEPADGKGAAILANEVTEVNFP